MRAFWFDGQGAFVPGFGRQYLADPAFESAFKAIETAAGLPLSEWAWGRSAALTPRHNDRLQITLFALNLALAHMTERKVGAPALVTGHSLGEVCALVYAGVLSLEDGARLVRRRGELMQKAAALSPQDMLVVFTTDHALIERWCEERFRGRVSVSNLNSADQIVVSGALDALKQFAQDLRTELRIETRLLGTGVACHSRFLESVEEEFNQSIDGLTLHKPRVPYHCVLAGRVLEDPEEIRSLLKRQMLAPVRWLDTALALDGRQFTSFVEIGPSKILKGLGMRSGLRTRIQTFAEAMAA